MKIKIKRVYEQPDREDGTRVLVDRLWPRGLTKEKAGVDLWLKEIAPSTELRKWFGHDPDKWVEFKKRYLDELKGNDEYPSAGARSEAPANSGIPSAMTQHHQWSEKTERKSDTLAADHVLPKTQDSL